MIVPFKDLNDETLTNMIESIVLREGTDYGQTEMSLADKVQMVKNQLIEGSAAIEFSEEHESVNIIKIP